MSAAIAAKVPLRARPAPFQRLSIPDPFENYIAVPKAPCLQNLPSRRWDRRGTRSRNRLIVSRSVGRVEQAADANRRLVSR